MGLTVFTTTLSTSEAAFYYLITTSISLTVALKAFETYDGQGR